MKFNGLVVFATYNFIISFMKSAHRLANFVGGKATRHGHGWHKQDTL